jgi:hypothetical protein
MDQESSLTMTTQDGSLTWTGINCDNHIERSCACGAEKRCDACGYGTAQVPHPKDCASKGALL